MPVKKASKSNEPPKKKIVRVSQSDVPAYSLEASLKVSEAIHENYAGDPSTPLNVATAMGLTPTSSHFRQLTGAAIAYGLTEGGYNAATIGLTELAKRIHAPLEEGQDLQAKRTAFLKPRVLNEFMNKYDGHAIPKQPIACNVLVELGVPKERTEQVLELILGEAKNLNLITEIKGKSYANLSSASSVVDTDDTDPLQGQIQNNGEEIDDEQPGLDSSKDELVDSGKHPTFGGEVSKENRRVFITHGKNKEFVEPIKKLLNFGELEAVVSVDIQSISKPVPDKVMDDMRSCAAAIIHVDGEQTLMDKVANEHVVLNPNVLIEIGAAMALYGGKFILLVKEGVTLPSNLQGLYEVRYTGSSLDGDATIRLLEAINQLKSHSK